MGKDRFLKKWCFEHRIAILQRIKLDYFLSCIKMHFKMNYRLKCKIQNHKIYIKKQ